MAQHDSMITPVVMLVAQFSTCIPTRSPESPPRAGPGRAQLLGSLVDSESEAPTPSLESDGPTQPAARMSRWHCHGAAASRRRDSESRSPDGHGGAPGHVDVRVTGTGTGALAILKPASEFHKSLIEPATAPKLGTYLAAVPGRASAAAGPLSAIMMVPMTPAGPGPRP
jgi:hypothetical protein